MESPQSPEKDRINKSVAMLRRMGMSLSVLGAIIFAAALMEFRQHFGGNQDVRSVLMLVSGIAMFTSGLYIWRSAKGTG